MVMQLAALVLTRALDVLFTPIPDCDEVFNYYEPLHFLVRGFGKRTWEYSPEYAIRSWAYLVPYAVSSWAMPLITDRLKLLPPYATFYFLRCVVVSFSVYAEYHMFTSLRRHSVSLANWYLLMSTVSTGMAHASVALLPSAWAMNCCLLASSNFVRWLYTRSNRNALLISSWLFIGAIFGWPFVGVLGLPPLVYIATVQWNTPKLSQYVKWSVAIGFIYLAASMEVDFFFYGKTLVVPLNIVLYNVIYADETSGPNIFGVEPVSYYINNILLNFNVVAVLAAVSPALIAAAAIITKRTVYLGFLAGITLPLVLWCWIFFLQPHKEERFLYPVYGLINASGAFSLSCVLTSMKTALHALFKRRVGKVLYRVVVVGVTALLLVVSTLRNVAFVVNYGAPLTTYREIPADATGNLCLTREWYRFPSSFFLPDTLRLRFVKSEFNGLLPGDFNEEQWLLQSVQEEPQGMNNKNMYDEGKVIDISHCDYAIDIDQGVSPEEYSFTNSSEWRLLFSSPFLNNEESSGVGKYLWLPTSLHGETQTHLVHHGYNLYKRITTE